MKKFIVLFVLVALSALYVTETQAQLGKKQTVWGRKVVADDSVRFSGPRMLAASSFVGDSTVKTIAVTGGQTTDKYFIQYTGDPGDSTLGTPTVTALAGFLVVKRQTAHAEANQAFIWFRSK